MNWTINLPGPHSMLGSGRGLTENEKSSSQSRPTGFARIRYDYYMEGYGWYGSLKDLAEDCGIDRQRLYKAYNSEQDTYHGLKIERKEK